MWKWVSSCTCSGILSRIWSSSTRACRCLYYIPLQTTTSESHRPVTLLFFIYFVSDILPPIPEQPEPAQPPLDPDQDFIRNFWSPPTNLYPYFLFPSSSHGTAHGTFRTHSNTGTFTGMGTGTGTGTATGTGTNSTAFGSHSSVEETLVTSLQFPELVVPGESAFSTSYYFCTV
mgnify:CR=1 FL=1